MRSDHPQRDLQALSLHVIAFTDEDGLVQDVRRAAKREGTSGARRLLLPGHRAALELPVVGGDQRP